MAHMKLMRNIKPGKTFHIYNLCEMYVDINITVCAGMMEYEAESLFLHYIYKDGGARSASFPPVAAAGSSGAVLHYGHAGAANDQEIKDGDMVRTILMHMHTLHFNASTE